jgi:SAM-dependent methyltransferase
MSMTTLGTSAQKWGALWGHRPQAWAVNEEQQTPVYEAALARVGLEAGDRVLDVGCGTGVFLRMCADRGADVAGIDAAHGLLDVARDRVPEADLRLADMVALPYADDSFDLVTGFTSFFFADDMARALEEAARVARPGAPVVIQVFGDPARCDLEAMKTAVSRYREETEEAYWRPGIAEAIAAQAGLDVTDAFDVTWAYAYPDAQALQDAMLAAGGAAAIAGPEREPALRADVLSALAHCRRPDGSYRVSNEWHVVIARA